MELEDIEDLFKFKRPRLRTLEKIVNEKINSPNLIEDILELKKCLENEINFTLDITKNTNIDIDFDKRSRFFKLLI